jgi:hypothetical protein
VFVLVSTKLVMMYPATDNPSSHEIRAVHDKNMSAAEIHREFCAVYDQNIMLKGTVKQWYRMFKMDD